MSQYDRVAALSALHEAAASRILVLDGAMGTEIQNLKLDEAAFRGERFVGHNHDQKGNNDLLILTQPEAVQAIHLRYFEAGVISSKPILFPPPASHRPITGWRLWPMS